MTIVTYSEAWRSGLREEMNLDPTIFVMGTDLQERGGHFAQVKGLAEEFGPERIRDAPISESAMVAAGVGSAMYGARPIIDLNFMDFSFGAMDEIVNQAAKIRYMFGADMPLIIRATAGIALFAAQHNNSFESMFSAIPGLSVAVPYRPFDVKGLLKTALRGSDPVIFIMHKKLTGSKGEIADENTFIPFGQARTARDGSDVLVVTYGYSVEVATKAAEALQEEGISVEVLDLRTLYPIDYGTVLKRSSEIGRIVVADEAPLFGSITGEIASTISEQLHAKLKAPVMRIGAKRVPIAANPLLVNEAIPSVEEYKETIRKSARY
jgi:pyruvate/2-oxoglutarate/acetoin dehydrogenase E1 component